MSNPLVGETMNELTTLRERVRFLEESNASMDRLHTTRMQECSEVAAVKEARIRELEEAMPDVGSLRRMVVVASYTTKDTYLAMSLEAIADRIEKVMKK